MSKIGEAETPTASTQATVATQPDSTPRPLSGLLPCPHCGNPPRVRNGLVDCPTCEYPFIGKPGVPLSVMIEKWNQRVAPPVVDGTAAHPAPGIPKSDSGLTGTEGTK